MEIELSKKNVIIAAVIVFVIAILWHLFLKNKKKTESSYATGPKFYRIKRDIKSAESSFGHGGGGHGHGGHGFHHGGRGGWRGGWGGYPYYPYPYYDDAPIIINSTKCPEDWVWMGAMVGCVKQPIQ